MAIETLFQDLSGGSEPSSAWLNFVVWPMLVLVAIFARPKGS